MSWRKSIAVCTASQQWTKTSLVPKPLHGHINIAVHFGSALANIHCNLHYYITPINDFIIRPNTLLIVFCCAACVQDRGSPACPGPGCACNNVTEPNVVCEGEPATFIVTVRDVQDTPPYFERLPYIAEVRENASVVRWPPLVKGSGNAV